MIPAMGCIRKIVSGGQTGVDRAALDVALKRGMACGGWCPRGRRAVDGVIDARYPLQETRSRGYQERTWRNVLDSDGTLILNLGKITGGTAYTLRMAREHQKPCLVVALDDASTPGDVIEWTNRHAIEVLNVAGPRDDQQSLTYRLAYQFLESLLGLNNS